MYIEHFSLFHIIDCQKDLNWKGFDLKAVWIII